MRHQVFCTFGDPAEIADAELIRMSQRRREHQASGVGEGLGSVGSLFCLLDGEAPASQGLGFREVQTKEFTVIVSHRFRHANIC